MAARTAGRKAGRPSSYSDDVATAICRRIADGESLRKICETDDMPSKTTVMEWLASDKHVGFRTKYARARELQADALFDEMLDIADDGSNDWMERNFGEDTRWVENGEAMRRSDLRIKTRQWMASKLMPKKYGEKVTLAGDAENPVRIIDRIELVAVKSGNGTDKAS